MIDVTDATFEQDVLVRSEQVPVVVDLWAPWCGPCRTLGPILEKAVEAKDGSVELVKVNVDENPRISAIVPGAVDPGRVRPQGPPGRRRVHRCGPRGAGRRVRGAPGPGAVGGRHAGRRPATRRRCGERSSSSPTTPAPWSALARLLVERGEPAEALPLLARIPETPEARQVAAEARLAAQQVEVPADGVDVLLDALLPKVKSDETARQEFLDLLETLGPDDPRTAQYRKALATRLF